MSSKQNTSVPRTFGGVGQRACIVPTSTTNAVIRVSSTQTFYHTARKTESHPPLPRIRNSTFIPSYEWRRDFPCRVIKQDELHIVFNLRVQDILLFPDQVSSVLWRTHDVCLASTSIHQRLSYLIIIIAADTNESC